MKSHLLTSVFMRMRPRLLSTARGILSGSDAEALDVLQDAFCRLWSRRDELSDESHAVGASVTAVRNASIDALRRRRTFTDVDVLESMPADDRADTSSDLLHEVENIIDRHLSERDRRILYLRDRYGYDIEAIGAELNLSEANVRMILSRARRTVRECYRQRINR